jgi:hypothetical protein
VAGARIHAAAAVVQPLQPQSQQQHAAETQPGRLASPLQLQQQAPTSQLPQPQRQQQPQQQQSQGPQRLGVSVLHLPVNAQPLVVSFETEADAEQRRLARQQAQLVAQLDNTEITSDDSDESYTPHSSVEDYALEAKYGNALEGRFEADAWLEDEAVFDSSDDVSGNDASDSDWTIGRWCIRSLGLIGLNGRVAPASYRGFLSSFVVVLSDGSRLLSLAFVNRCMLYWMVQAVVTGAANSNSTWPHCMYCLN